MNIHTLLFWQIVTNRFTIRESPLYSLFQEVQHRRSKCIQSIQFYLQTLQEYKVQLVQVTPHPPAHFKTACTILRLPVF